MIPNIRFVAETPPRIIFAVEDTAVMNMQKRWEFVRKAVRRIAVYDIPDGAHVGVVVFNSVAHTVAPLLKIDSISDVRQRLGSSLPRNPSTVPESQKCVLCGLQESLRALDLDNIGAAGANIILITTGTNSRAQNHLQEMNRLIKSRYVRVTPVLYPLVEKPGETSSLASKGLACLAKASDKVSSSFTVVDKGVGNDSKISMLVALMDALLAAVQTSTSENASNTPLIVESSVYPGGKASVSTGSFTLDDTLGSDARFSIYYYDLNHVGNTIQLITPTGSVRESINMQKEDYDANIIYVNILNAERGLWRYKIENRADSHQGLHVQVTALPSAERKISVKVWTSIDIEGRERSEEVKPRVLFAEVKEQNKPILNSRVFAKLQRLGTNTTGSGFEPVFMDLYDNGIGGE